MSSFSRNVGLRYTEIMKGNVTPGETEPAAGDSPVSTGKSAFRFDLEVVIPSLEAFLEGPEFTAKIESGKVKWGFLGSKSAKVTSGMLGLFVKKDGRRDHKSFVFDLYFDYGQGKVFHLVGVKKLLADGFLDWAADLSTLFVHVFDTSGACVGAGVLRVEVWDLLRLASSIRITNADGLYEEQEARNAFMAFMNDEIRDVYPYVPSLYHDPRHLTPEQWTALRLILEVMLPDPLPENGPTLRRVLSNLQRFVSNAQGDKLRSVLNQLWAIAALEPILKALDRDELRRFIREQLKSDEQTFVRDLLEQMTQVANMPYYGDTASHPVLRYTRTPAEPRRAVEIGVREAPEKDLTYDFVIVGSGVAGSLLAARLAEKHPDKKVLVLEAGPFVREREVSDGDEVKWSAKLYKESGLQRAVLAGTKSTMPVLQGSCIGGGAMVNNIVCFRLPQQRLQRWWNAGFPLKMGQLHVGYDVVAHELGIRPVSKAVKNRAWNPAWDYVAKYLGPASPSDPFSPIPLPGARECLVNVVDEGCIGCGECNVACGSERKSNALQVYLPRATAAGAHVVPDAKVSDMRLVSRNGKLTVTELIVDIPRVQDRPVRVKGREIILCASAIGSPSILQRAEDARDKLKNLPIGKGFSANIGSPVFAFYDRDVTDGSSLQIAHYYLPSSEDSGFVIESWQNPPGATALAMPGYLDEHHSRMKQYLRVLSAAPLVGTMPTGSVQRKSGETQIVLDVDTPTFSTLKKGLWTVGNAFLSGGAGPAKLTELLFATRGGTSVRNRQELAWFLNGLKGPEDLLIGTGHPQGGCAMSSGANGVVDENFKVKGVDNLRICDASIFPDSAGVNPQWTIMALAHHLSTLL